MAKTPPPPVRLQSIRHIHISVPPHLRPTMFPDSERREVALKSFLGDYLDLEHRADILWQACQLIHRSTEQVNPDRVLVEVTAHNLSMLDHDHVQTLCQRLRSTDRAPLSAFYDGEVWLRLPGPTGICTEVRFEPTPVLAT